MEAIINTRFEDLEAKISDVSDQLEKRLDALRLLLNRPSDPVKTQPAPVSNQPPPPEFRPENTSMEDPEVEAASDKLQIVEEVRESVVDIDSSEVVESFQSEQTKKEYRYASQKISNMLSCLHTMILPKEVCIGLQHDVKEDTLQFQHNMSFQFYADQLFDEIPAKEEARFLTQWVPDDGGLTKMTLYCRLLYTDTGWGITWFNRGVWTGIHIVWNPRDHPFWINPLHIFKHRSSALSFICETLSIAQAAQLNGCSGLEITAVMSKWLPYLGTNVTVHSRGRVDRTGIWKIGYKSAKYMLEHEFGTPSMLALKSELSPNIREGGFLYEVKSITAENRKFRDIIYQFLRVTGYPQFCVISLTVNQTFILIQCRVIVEFYADIELASIQENIFLVHVQRIKYKEAAVMEVHHVILICIINVYAGSLLISRRLLRPKVQQHMQSFDGTIGVVDTTYRRGVIAQNFAIGALILCKDHSQIHRCFDSDSSIGSHSQSLLYSVLDSVVTYLPPTATTQSSIVSRPLLQLVVHGVGSMVVNQKLLVLLSFACCPSWYDSVVRRPSSCYSNDSSYDRFLSSSQIKATSLSNSHMQWFDIDSDYDPYNLGGEEEVFIVVHRCVLDLSYSEADSSIHCRDTKKLSYCRKSLMDKYYSWYRDELQRNFLWCSYIILKTDEILGTGYFSQVMFFGSDKLMELIVGSRAVARVPDIQVDGTYACIFFVLQCGHIVVNTSRRSFDPGKNIFRLEEFTVVVHRDYMGRSYGVVFQAFGNYNRATTHIDLVTAIQLSTMLVTALHQVKMKSVSIAGRLSGENIMYLVGCDDLWEVLANILQLSDGILWIPVVAATLTDVIMKEAGQITVMSTKVFHFWGIIVLVVDWLWEWQIPWDLSAAMLHCQARYVTRDIRTDRMMFLLSLEWILHDSLWMDLLPTLIKVSWLWEFTTQRWIVMKFRGQSTSLSYVSQATQKALMQIVSNQNMGVYCRGPNLKTISGYCYSYPHNSPILHLISSSLQIKFCHDLGRGLSLDIMSRLFIQNGAIDNNVLNIQVGPFSSIVQQMLLALYNQLVQPVFKRDNSIVLVQVSGSISTQTMDTFQQCVFLDKVAMALSSGWMDRIYHITAHSSGVDSFALYHNLQSESSPLFKSSIVHVLKTCIQWKEAVTSYILPGLLSFVERLAYHLDIERLRFADGFLSGSVLRLIAWLLINPRVITEDIICSLHHTGRLVCYQI